MIKLGALVTREPRSSDAQMIDRAFWGRPPVSAEAHVHDFLAIEFEGYRACVCGQTLRKVPSR